MAKFVGLHNHLLRVEKHIGLYFLTESHHIRDTIDFQFEQFNFIHNFLPDSSLQRQLHANLADLINSQRNQWSGLPLHPAHEHRNTFLAV